MRGRPGVVRSLLLLLGALAACSGRRTEAAPAAAAPPPPPPAAALRGPARSHGLTIPEAHPRIWFDAERLKRARAWSGRNGFRPNQWRGLGWSSFALKGLLDEDEGACAKAVEWAMAFDPTRGPIQDNLRWHGQNIALVFDWCHGAFTPAQRTELITRWNGHFTTQMNYGWAAMGGVDRTRSGPMGNYYWGVVRSLSLWAVATYHENPEAAERFLAHALAARVQGEWAAAAATTGKGGVGTDSSHYGQLIRHYATIPFETARLHGRDLFAESSYWLEAVYFVLYSTPPGPSSNNGKESWDYFPFGDEEFWNTSSSNGGDQARLDTFGDFMTLAATRWAGSNTGRWASQWLATVKPLVNPHVASVTEALPKPLAFDGLPLDYYAAGPAYWYGHSHPRWADGTTFAMTLGYGTVGGHVHDDHGTWQLWRGGRWLSRETTEYSKQIAGYANGAPTGVSKTAAHNGLLVGGKGLADSPQLSRNGLPVVTRLQSHPAFAFASVDLSGSYRNDVKEKWHPERDNPAARKVVRDFVFVRDLETLVILDRVEADADGRTKTFLAHCEEAWGGAAPRRRTCTAGRQQLALTTLLPAAPAYRVVVEGGRHGQHRLEVDDPSPPARSHLLHLLQAKDAGGPALEPTVSEDGARLTVTLDASHRIVFEKGMSSAGGSITIGGATVPLRADVQGMTVGEGGPIWQ